MSVTKTVIDYLLPVYRRLPGFRGKYRLGRYLFQSVLDRPEPVSVQVGNGLTFHLPNSIENIGKEILLLGTYEKESVNAIVEKLQTLSKPVFFDVGANIGAISIPVQKQLPAAEVHAFEASPQTYRFLQKNFACNQLSVQHLNNQLISSSDGLALEFFDSIQYGKSSLAPTYATDSILLNTVSIEQYCRERNIHVIDLMKVDVQGFELDVFKGMASLLAAKKVAFIFFEFEDWAEHAAGFQPGTSQEFLLDHGYALYTENGERLSRVVVNGSHMLWAKPVV